MRLHVTIVYFCIGSVGNACALCGCLCAFSIVTLNAY